LIITSTSDIKRSVSGTITIETDNSIYCYSAIASKQSSDNKLSTCCHGNSINLIIKSASDIKRRISGTVSIETDNSIGCDSTQYGESSSDNYFTVVLDEYGSDIIIKSG
jgi:hypothetical protein